MYVLEEDKIYLIEFTSSKNEKSNKIITINKEFYKYYFQVKLDNQLSNRKRSVNTKLQHSIVISNQKINDDWIKNEINFRTLTKEGIKIKDYFEINNKKKIIDFINKFEGTDNYYIMDDLFLEMKEEMKKKINKIITSTKKISKEQPNKENLNQMTYEDVDFSFC